MDEPNKWGPARYAALAAVLTLHLALFSLLLLPARSALPAGSAMQPVELIFLPPLTPPRVRAQLAPPRRLSADTLIAIAPPVLTAVSPSPSPSPAAAGSSDGRGSGVDWEAEARRALQAFDIRNREPRPVSPAENDWWALARHHVGEQIRTPNGDWIIWLDANCYQVASAAPSVYAIGAELPQTVCHDTPEAGRK